jgi:hypothetical protein
MPWRTNVLLVTVREWLFSIEQHLSYLSSENYQLGRSMSMHGATLRMSLNAIVTFQQNLVKMIIANSKHACWCSGTTRSVELV